MKEDVISAINSLCSVTERPPADSLIVCPLKQQNCICCLFESVLLHRLKRVEQLNENIPDSSITSSDTRIIFTAKLIYLIGKLVDIWLLESVTNINEFAFSCGDVKSLSLAFEAIFLVQLIPCIPESLIIPMNKRLPADSALSLSSSHPHPLSKEYTLSRYMTIRSHCEKLLACFLACPPLLKEFLGIQCGKYLEDFVAVLVYLTESQFAKELFGADECLKLANTFSEFMEKLPADSAMYALLTNLNICSNNKGIIKAELAFASQTYGRYLSKILVTGSYGLQKFIEVYLQTLDVPSLDKVPLDDIWKRSSAIASVLIRCPGFMKPSQYYSKIGKQLVAILDQSMPDKEKEGKVNMFPSCIFSSVLMQPQFVARMNSQMGLKLSKYLRLYVIPLISEPQLQIDVWLNVKFPESFSILDMQFLPRLCSVVHSTPITVWKNMEASDLHILLRSFCPLILEIYSEVIDNNIVSPLVISTCQSLANRFILAFPIITNSQSADILSDWLVRSPMPKGMQLKIPPLIISEDSSPFKFQVIENVSNHTNIGHRMRVLKTLLEPKCRGLALWSLFLSSLRRLLLFLDSKDTGINRDLNLLLGSLSEDVAELTEEEMSSLMTSQMAMDNMIELVEILSDRLLKLFENDEDAKEIAPLLENSFSVLISIVSSVFIVSKPENAETIEKLKSMLPKLKNLSTSSFLSERCQELVKAFLVVLDPVYLEELRKEHKEEFNAAKIEKQFEEAFADIADPMCPVKGHGLITARRIVETKHISDADLTSHLFSIFLKNLNHEDSYVHLNAAAALTSLGLRYHQQLIYRICSIYSSRSDNAIKTGDNTVETKIRLGECLCRIIRGLGELAPAYRDVILDSCLVLLKSTVPVELEENDKIDYEVKVYSSALSTLGQLSGVLKFSLSSNSSEILSCISAFLSSTSQHLEVRRAAACALALLLDGFKEDRSQIFALADVLRDVGRMLRLNRSTCLDDVLLLHIDLGLTEIDRLGRLMLTPEKEYSIVKLV